MPSRVRVVVVATLIVLAGVLFFVSDTPPSEAPSNGIEVGPPPRGPDPSQYPGGLANRDYQRAARAFEAAMHRHIESISAAGDAAEAEIERETGSLLLRLLAFVALVAAVGVAVGSRSVRRATNASPSEAASTSV